MTRPERRDLLFVLLAAAISGLVLPPVASAADMSVKAPIASMAAPVYNWSGPYVGVNFGAGWSNGSLNIPGNNLYGGITEFIGGGQVGYNVQPGHLLFGVEGDFDGASFNHPALPVPTLGLVNQHWISTVAGRFGLVNDRWLVFGKLGGGWVQGAVRNVVGIS
jgi:opacity protein-like surface antigen